MQAGQGGRALPIPPPPPPSRQAGRRTTSRTVTSASSQLAEVAGQQLQAEAGAGPPPAGQPAAWRMLGAGYASRPPVTCTSV
jgi:hypothetical protein